MATPIESTDQFQLRQLATDLWVAEAPLRFFGLPLGTRMTVVRLPDGGLFLHSPVAPTAALREAVAALGPVRHVIAPNLYHHLFAGDWLSFHPAARLHAAPGLGDKRTDLSISAELCDDPHEDWAPVLDQVAIRGMPGLNETAFFHRPSGSLIATDLAFNIGPSDPWPTRVAFWVLGAHGKLAPTFLERLQAKDRPALRASVDHVIAWDFDRAIVAHGAIVESGGREQLARGYAWLAAQGG